MKQVIRKRLWSIVLLFAMVLSGIGGTFTIAQAKTPTVNFRVKTKKLTVGKSYQLKFIKAKNIKIRKKTFSKKGSAVRITKKGKVVAKKRGKATVYCKVKYQRKGFGKLYGKKLKCKIIVNDAGTGKDRSGNGAGQSTALPKTSTMPDVTVSGATNRPSGQTTAKPGTVEPPGQTTAKPGTVEPSGQTTAKPGTVEPSGQITPKPGTTEPSGQGTPKPVVSAAPIPTVTVNPGDGKPIPNAFELVHQMGLGINLGNTMEAYRAGASTTAQLETYWGQPITTQAMITGMKKAGFHSVRVPVSWSSMMSNDGKYTIDARLLKRIAEIIQYAFQEDMYVIINIHWDGQWWGQFGDADSSVREKAWARYEAFWTQISDYYRDYSDYLIFESANEELGERLNDDWKNISSSEKPGTLNEDERYQTVNAINQKFVDIVRASGGNNANRFLLIAGYNTDIDKTCDGRYMMPKDTISDHMIVSVHYYSPPTYCLVDKEDNSWGYMASWGTDDDIAAMKAQLAVVKRSFVNQGIPVVIGEYGVADTTVAANTYVRKEGRDLFFQTLCDYAVNNGMCPMLWNTGNVYDKSSCKLKNESEAAIYSALEKQVDEMEVYVPEEFTGEHH